MKAIIFVKGGAILRIIADTREITCFVVDEDTDEAPTELLDVDGTRLSAAVEELPVAVDSELADSFWSQF